MEFTASYETEVPRPTSLGPMPYESPSAGADALELCVDETFTDGAFIWLELAIDDGQAEIVPAREAHRGYEAWFEEQVMDDGIASLLEIDRSDPRSAIDWCMREGITAGQPFAVWVPHPVWEYDCWTGFCDGWSTEPVVVRRGDTT